MIEELIPKLSPEIVIHPFDNNSFFIHQTEFDYRVRITPEMKLLVDKVDNKRTVKEIVELYNTAQSTNLSTAYVHKILYNNLGRYGIVVNPDIKVTKSGKPSYLKLSFIVLSPNRVGYFTRFLKFLFIKPLFICVFLFGISFLLATQIIYFNEVMSAPLNIESTLTFFLFSFIGITFHEFGHATAADYYGAKHGGIGGGFYLFMPVYYADVSDIWKLRKDKRIVVNLAGVYFEIIYSLVIVTLGMLMKNFFFISFGCVFSLYTLFNLNPFLRSDGYWVLADILSKPNLLKSSTEVTKSIFRGKRIKQKDTFLFVYGIVTYLMITYFLYIVVINDPDSLLKLPINIWKLFEKVYYGIDELRLEDLTRLLLPILFYYLSFTFLKEVIIKYMRRKHLT